MMKKILSWFLIVRLLSVILIQTWFVPDETWQMSEIAHYWIFGYGYISWEWKEAIRSILYPGIFSLIYYVLFMLNLDYVFLLIHIPRLLSAVFFAVGDYFMYKLFVKLFGKASSGLVAVSISTSWFLTYCSPRTLSSCAEMVLFAIALYSYPWHDEIGSLDVKYIAWGGIGCVIRPTLAIFLAPYCIRHLFLSNKKMSLILRYILNVLLILILSVGIDSLFYGKVTLVPWNFLKFNLLSGLSAHYGTHPWHWYITQGLPVTCGLHIVPLVIGSIQHFKRYSCILLPTLCSIIIYSFIGHKEFRFLLPIIPVLLMISGETIYIYLKKFSDKKNEIRRTLITVIIMIVPNILAIVYLGSVHQRGPLEVMSRLRETVNADSKLLFLTPCHSTPLYSHLHMKIPARFLTCEPNLRNVPNYKDEADLFYEGPLKWFQKEYLNNTDLSMLPTHVIIFDSLRTSLEESLLKMNYYICAQVFNAHFYDGNRGKYFIVYCR